jgi:hypothetical protein
MLKTIFAGLLTDNFKITQNKEPSFLKLVFNLSEFSYLCIGVKSACSF